MNNAPIGILDSGVGGLSVWKEIATQLPNESTIYIADSKNIPYGTKSPEEIYELASRLIHFLLEKHVKIIVIACNTITVTNIERLRQEFKYIPIIGTVPVVKRAVEKTKNGKIGVLSTLNTAQSGYQEKLIEKFAQEVEVVNVGTDKLVPLVEKGEIEGKHVRNTLQTELKPFKEAEVDVLALGCTHFPFLEREMRKILGKDVLLLDSGAAIARHIHRVLEHNDAISNQPETTHNFFTTGDEDMFKKTIDTLLHGFIVDNTVIRSVQL